LGLSFAILVLYIGYLQSIALAVLLLTASVVVASRDDLTELRSDKAFVVIIIAFAAVIFLSVALFLPPFNIEAFYALIGVNFALLLTYLALRIASSRN
jgi:hypothetical protein